ncbi:MAG: YfbK domain-containing protein [Vicinamibacteria bacterium]
MLRHSGGFHAFLILSVSFLAAAVASFGMLLRESPHRGEGTWEMVEELARGAKGDDRDGYRAEFLELVALASEIQRLPTSASRR